MSGYNGEATRGQHDQMISWGEALESVDFFLEQQDFNSAKGLVKKLLNYPNIHREEDALSESKWSTMFEELREEHYARRRRLVERLQAVGDGGQVAAAVASGGRMRSAPQAAGSGALQPERQGDVSLPRRAFEDDDILQRIEQDLSATRGSRRRVGRNSRVGSAAQGLHRSADLQADAEASWARRQSSSSSDEA
eukprot:TRINITY_DN56232_c0_g1_i1.p1 TRINITY_DN56232_c0_g1~~TRINITY_DN56232_c0_g1_i1.p1  ORF type:complete len:194 (-),score=47.35 TRINITY_DN56232_c0_g1_i1:76-657(-)